MNLFSFQDESRSDEDDDYDDKVDSTFIQNDTTGEIEIESKLIDDVEQQN